MGKSIYHVCYHCKDRKVGCHSNCEQYQKEVEENNRIKSVMRKVENRQGAIREAKTWNRRPLKGTSHKK